MEEFKKVNFVKTDYKEKFGEKKSLLDLDYTMVNKAQDKLQEMYNSCEQQRKFVQHLIKAFLPIDMWHRLVDVESEPLRCAILNYKVTGIRKVSECYGKIGTERLLAASRAIVGHRNKPTDEDINKINQILKEYPVEVQKCRIGLRSDRSNKILMVESAFALQDLACQLNINLSKAFYSNTIEVSNQECENQKPLVEKIKINVESNYALSDKLDSKSLNALGAMKEYLEIKQKD